MNKEKYQYLIDNINYILGPYYIFNQKNGVTRINYRKLKQMPNNLLKTLVNFLIYDDNDELYQLVNNMCNNKSFIKNHINEVYLGLNNMDGVITNHQKDCYLLLLDQIKKYLNKTNNSNYLQILKTYYKIDN